MACRGPYEVSGHREGSAGALARVLGLLPGVPRATSRPEVMGEGSFPGLLARLIPSLLLVALVPHPTMGCSAASGAPRASGGLPTEDLPQRPPPSPPIPSLEGQLETAVRPIENPEGLGPFTDGLVALSRGEARVVRVAYLGDSHVAADLYTHYLRRALQARFGDGGHGFVLPGTPWVSYRHGDLSLGATGPWSNRFGRHIQARDPQARILGLGGAAMSSDSPVARWWIQPARRTGRGSVVSEIRVHYLAGPGRGSFTVSADRARLATIATGARGREVRVARLNVEPGWHRVEVAPVGDGWVTLLGAALETGSGVVVDTLGINGATAATPLQWDEEVWAAELEARDPDLVVVAYGANEAGISPLRTGWYGQTFSKLLRRIRRAAPRAGCLVVAPLDRARLERGEQWRTMPTILQIVAIQRQEAAAAGCAFWNTFAAFGGVGAMDAWANADPPLARSDHVHLTPRGYKILAKYLELALIRAAGL